MTLTYDQIRPYIEKGLIAERPHPLHADVRIFNYTQECTWSQAWDDVTRACRGLVLNVKTGEVLANPFPKFYNYQEHIQKEWPIPDEEPVITEKLDGSLGILVHLDGTPWIATRGSFESDQAVWATKWWRENMPQLTDGHVFNKTTHLFEIVYPQNRIVVGYDFSGLVYLGSRDTQTGDHVDDSGLFSGTPVRIAKTVPVCDLETLAAMDEPNSEGFVCHYPTSNTRLKVKFAEYVRLHKILTGLSEIGIWEGLRDGKPLELEGIPDEFMDWMKGVSRRLVEAAQRIEQEVEEDYVNLVMWADKNGYDALNPSDRKEIALWVKQTKYPGILFSVLDQKPFFQTIWKMVRPKGARVFHNDIDA